MNRLFLLLLAAVLQPGCSALAEDHGRIKKVPPTPVEAERIASDMAMNDGSLHKGDIVATDRGFFQFRGPAPDGISNDFVRVPNPLSSGEGSKYSTSIGCDRRQYFSECCRIESPIALRCFLI
jgi:hypothetical protein